MANPFRRLFGARTPTADLAAPARPVMGELATLAAGRDITRGVVEGLPLLPPQDEWQGCGGGLWLDVYRQVLDDFQVFSALQQRRLGLIAAEWEVLPGGTARKDKQAAELIGNVIEDVLPWDRITEQMHYGVFYGYAASELIWQRDGRHIIPEAIKVRDQRRFAYDPEGRLRLLTVGNPLGELLPERKFWTFSTGATHEDDPYGMGLAHWCFWPAQFKRGIAKLWLIALDKYASPTAMGHFPPGASADEQAKLLAALAAIRNQAALILPEGMTAELLAASRSGGADYDTAARYWDTAISKIILGHSAGADATPGRLGGEDSSDAVRADLVKADADVLCGSANATWVRWVTEWSLPGAIPPQIWRRTDEEEDLSERADRERKLFDVGYRPTLAQVVATYGGEWERVQAGTAEALADGAAPTTANDAEPPESSDTEGGTSADGAGARVGEADPDDVPADLAAPTEPDSAPDYAQLTVAALGRRAEPAVQAMAARIREELDAAIAAGESPADLMARLERLYPQLPDGDLVAVMGEALAAAELAGRFAVTEGRA
jgi:phage gp29-like protein